MVLPLRTARLRRAMLICSIAWLTASAAPRSASAAHVTNVRANHRDGQTVLTWDNLPGTGWQYRVYAANRPFASLDIVDPVLVGTVGDSSGVDLRISQLLGQSLTFRPESNGAPLAPSQGLFVATAPESRSRWYVVTAQPSGGPEDVELVRGENALSSAVRETIGRPVPVWQRTLTHPAGEDYVLWGSDVESTEFSSLTSVPSRAFHIGVRRGDPGQPLILHGHGRGGSFLNSLAGLGLPGESVVSVDDWLASGDAATWYFGHHPRYNPDSPNTSTPYSGRVADYTDRRVLLFLDWAEAQFGSDPNRVYAAGASMGGTFAVFLAWHHPDRIAAAYAGVPMLTFSYQPDATPVMRPSMDRMWGPLDFDLECTNGYATYNWLDGRWLAEAFEWRGSAPIMAFHGRNDDIIGWPSTRAYLAAESAHRDGGMHFWDNSGHVDWASGDWAPEQLPAALVGRYRLDRSWPAFSNCSADGIPGDGTAASGTAIGQINGTIDFDPALVEHAGEWQVRLFTRALTTTSSALVAPESVIVDVTPRRLQSFRYNSDTPVLWTAIRSSDGAVVQSGTVMPDGLGLVTVPGVKVYRGGTELHLQIETTAGVGGATPSAPRLRLALSANPVRGAAVVRLAGVAPGPIRLDLVDVAGRTVRRVYDGVATEGGAVPLRTHGLPPGLYWLRAAQERALASARVVVLR